MSKYEKLREQLKGSRSKWLITGVAGFIGSNLLETLLKLGQRVIGVDNFITGYQKNINEALNEAGTDHDFEFVEGDICDPELCRELTGGVDFVLHQAALGSVPRSIENPLVTNTNNIDGFLNILVAAKDNNIKSFVYAASSSTYGDYAGLPKVENKIGNPLSPYAVTKLANELYARVFTLNYGYKAIGLRYFNVFGKRQDPDGAYAAVIPKWTSFLIRGEQVFINGDGKTSRDFCYIDNAVQANLLAAFAADKAKGEVYNIAVGERTDLNELFNIIKSCAREHISGIDNINPVYREFREGDVRHSLADISKARRLLGFEPQYRLHEGINKSMKWYIDSLRTKG